MRPQDRDFAGLLGHERKLKREHRKPGAWLRVNWYAAYRRMRLVMRCVPGYRDLAGPPFIRDPLAWKALRAYHGRL